MIIIRPYNPKWPEEFASIKSPLQAILGDLALRIDHVGSTSVPGLSAKDMIDIQISVKALGDQIRRKLSQAGYQVPGEKVTVTGPQVGSSAQLAVAQ